MLFSKTYPEVDCDWRNILLDYRGRQSFRSSIHTCNLRSGWYIELQYRRVDYGTHPDQRTEMIKIIMFWRKKTNAFRPSSLNMSWLDTSSKGWLFFDANASNSILLLSMIINLDQVKQYWLRFHFKDLYFVKKLFMISRNKVANLIFLLIQNLYFVFCFFLLITTKLYYNIAQNDERVLRNMAIKFLKILSCIYCFMV